MEKMSGDPSDQRNSATAGNWQFVNNPMGQGIQMGSSSCPPVSIAEPFPPGFWKHPAALQNPGFSENAAIVSNVPMFDMGWNDSDPTIPRMEMLPPSPSDFAADSSFIDRAARVFCEDNLGSMPNPFGTSASKNVSMSIDHGSKSDNPMKNQGDSVVSEEESPDLRNVSGNSSSKGLGAMKRKKTRQDMELDKGGSQFSGESSKENVVTTGKSRGKNAKGSTDAGKDDYIHVRARSGQATKSHSLAERVRRERISERMKYLQDLVPGCSKVTGKAVMLDEIINYVQSLQRQVEFLSMKLATVNPSIDFNIEGLLSKDQLFQSHGGPSTMGFSQELIHHQLIASQQGLIQTGIPGTVNQSDVLRRAINAQFAMVNGFKEPATQLQESWEAEVLQNVIQMTFGTIPHPNTQESNSKPHEALPM